MQKNKIVCRKRVKGVVDIKVKVFNKVFESIGNYNNGMCKDYEVEFRKGNYGDKISNVLNSNEIKNIWTVENIKDFVDNEEVHLGMIILNSKVIVLDYLNQIL